MPYSILSLDGGGTWALIQARMLCEKYGLEKRGHAILRDFDLVIANSGGSLVLAMLCADKPMQEILDIFNDVSVLSDIFKKKLMSHIPGLNGIFPNYHAAHKYEVFRKYLHNKNDGVSYGDLVLTELPQRIGKESLQIIITGFDYDNERAVYFRSNPMSRMESTVIRNEAHGANLDPEFNFSTTTLSRAVHASSNAPIQFFDEPAAFPLSCSHKYKRDSTLKDRLYWDGAVGGNNNPVKSGVLEALANNVRRDDIRIVSLGTSGTIKPICFGEPEEPVVEYDFLCRESRIDSFPADLRRMTTSILSDPPDAATFDSHVILGLPYTKSNARLIRINPLIKPLFAANTWVMPGRKGSWTAREMEDLFTLDMAVATKYGIGLINRLCDDFVGGWFDNQGVRTGGPAKKAILGHGTFAEAIADWKAWDDLA